MKYLMRLVIGLIFIGFYSINVLNAMERKMTAADQRTANTAAARLKNIQFRFKTGNMPLAAYQDAQRMIKTLETYGKADAAEEWKGVIDSLASAEVKERAMAMEKPGREMPRAEEELGEAEKLAKEEAEKLAREEAERMAKLPAEEAEKAEAERLAKAKEKEAEEAEKLAKAKEAEEAEKKISTLNLMIWNRSKEFTITCSITDKDGKTIEQDIQPLVDPRLSKESTFKLSGIPTKLTVRAKGVVKTGGWFGGGLSDGPEQALNITNLRNEINNNITKYAGSNLYIRVIFKDSPGKEKWEKENIDLGFVWSCLRLWNDADVDVKYEIFDSSNASIESGVLASEMSAGTVVSRLASSAVKAKLENATDASITKEIDLTPFQKQVQDEKDAKAGALPYLSILNGTLDTKFEWVVPEG